MGQQKSRYTSNNQPDDNYFLITDGVNSDGVNSADKKWSVFNISDTSSKITIKEESFIKEESLKDILNKKAKDVVAEKMREKKKLKNEINDYFFKTQFFVYDMKTCVENVCEHISKIADEGKTEAGFSRKYFQTNADLGLGCKIIDIGICDIGEVYNFATKNREWKEVLPSVKKRFRKWVYVNMSMFISLFKERTKCETDLKLSDDGIQLTISWK